MPPARAELWIGAAAAAALALLVAYVFLPLLGAELVLPGRDSVNLYAWELYTRSVLSAGRFPHWNPYHFAGTPHLADPQTTVLYPPAVLLRWLDAASFFTWMAALHVWIGGVGALFLGRVLGLGWLAACAAACAAMLGGSIGGWLQNGHLLVIYCAAWLPWALGFAILSARRRSLLPHPLLVAVVVLTLLTGYLQGAIYVVGAVCLYFVFSAAWPDGATGADARWRPLAQLALLGILAAGLSAFQLLPTSALVSQAGRTSGVEYAASLDGAWGVRDLAKLFFPFNGVLEDPPHRGLSDAAVYGGWALTCLLPFAFFDRQRRRFVVFFAILAVGAMAVALGDALPFYRLHHAIFPGLRRPGRILLLVTLSIAVLGACGLERFVGAAAERDWKRLRVAFVAAAIAALMALGVVRSAAGPAILPMHAWPWLPLAVAGGLLIALALATAGGRQAALATVLVLVAFDLTTFAAGAPKPVDVIPAATIREWIGAPDEGRVLSVCERAVGPGEFIAVRAATLDGMAAISLGNYGDWAYIARTGGRPVGDGMYRRVGDDVALPARRDLIDAANVTTIVSCRTLDAPSMRRMPDHGSMMVYRNEQAWPRAIWTCDAQPRSREDAVNRLLESRYEGYRLVRLHRINVRWSPAVPEARRRALEAQYDLREGTPRDESTWTYVLGNISKEHLLSLMRNPDIDDTHGIDRQSGELVEPPRDEAPQDSRSTLLIGAGSCEGPGTLALQVKDHADGTGRSSTVVDAPADDGVVFFSDAFYSERRAFVDGREVQALNANLAFTAVPVARGRHIVELRYVPRSFKAGTAVSIVTVGAWLGVPLAGYLRRKRTRVRVGRSVVGSR